MKKKVVIINSLLIFAVLFAMLFQSIHSYEHLSQQLTEKKCHHKHISSHEITHKHHNLEHCFICDFTLSTFLNSNIFVFEFKNNTLTSGTPFLKSREKTQFFKGSLFALRAPPVFIV